MEKKVEKLDWKVGNYGGHSLTLANGFIRLYCDYNGFAPKSIKNPGYTASINAVTLKKRFPTIEAAKNAALGVAFREFSLGVEQLKNFID